MTKPEACRQFGVMQLVLDRVGPADRDRALGSRALKAKATVSYSMRITAPFDRTKTGTVVVELGKNTCGAALPARRTFTAGGGGDGRFV